MSKSLDALRAELVTRYPNGEVRWMYESDVDGTARFITIPAAVEAAIEARVRAEVAAEGPSTSLRLAAALEASPCKAFLIAPSYVGAGYFMGAVRFNCDKATHDGDVHSTGLVRWVVGGSHSGMLETTYPDGSHRSNSVAEAVADLQEPEEADRG